MHQYESGQQTPRPEVMRLLPDLLRVDPSFFFAEREMGADDERPIYWRSLSAASKSSRERSCRRYEWLRDIVRYLRQYIELPTASFPVAAPVTQAAQLSTAQIDTFARDVRQHWGIGDGPISNLVLLLENKGAVITRAELGTYDLDAFSQYRLSEGVPYVFLSSDKDCAARSRFDLAHELGHLTLHRHVPRATTRRGEQHKLMEQQANLFAGAFLLPTAAFVSELVAPTLEMMLRMKQRWRVSVGAMIGRVEQLGLASAEQIRRLWISYNRRGWKRNEPYDDMLPIEEPTLLRSAISMLVEQGVRTRADILADLPFSQQDIEELTGLPPNFLSHGAVPLRLRQFSHPRRSAAGGGTVPRAQKVADVIPFARGSDRKQQ